MQDYLAFLSGEEEGKSRHRVRMVDVDEVVFVTASADFAYH